MKILFHSVAPWAPTGYGTQAGIFVPRIKSLGHDIAMSVYYGLQGAELKWNGITCYPSYSAAYGADVIVPHALHHFGAEDAKSIQEAAARGLIITLGDVWTFESPILDQLSVGAWVPVDHLGVPDVVRNWFGKFGAVPIAMSRFGEAALREAGMFPLYVPHGIDTGVFRPGDKAEARAATGVPEDAFVVGMVANNAGRDGSRKAFSEQIAAFAELHRRHPDTMLVLHTDVDAPHGVRLRSLLERTLPKGSYTYTDVYTYRKGMNASAVADIHRSFDVLSNCSYGEGFGIPIVEAQACGTPVIVTDATAMSELCGSGWKVGYEPMWHDSQGGWAAKPLIGDIVDAYESAYDKARDEGMRADAHGFAQDYDADLVLEKHWKPALAWFEEALELRRVDAARPRPPAAKEKIRQADGFLWLDRGNQSDDWVAYQDHERWLLPIFDRVFPDGGVLLDVGAHVGRWSIRLAGRADQVIAVEANPSTAATLRRHLAMNDVHNVTVVEVAAWDEHTELAIDDPNGRVDGGGARTLAHNAQGDHDCVLMDCPGWRDGGVTVQASPLDGIPAVWNALGVAHPMGRLDLVKVDVEGADIHALRGMRDLLTAYRPKLLVECHDIYGYYKREDLEQTLTDLGYRFEVCSSEPSNWQPGVGIIDEIRMADYLLAEPVEVTDA